MNQEQEPQPEQQHELPGFRVKSLPSLPLLKRRFSAWLQDQIPLGEAFFVAVTFHILLFPLLWFVGWALPWPKSPVITTVIEINLEHWPEEARPEKIEEIYNLKLNEMREGH